MASYESYEQCIHPSDRDRYQSLIKKLLSKPFPYQLEYRIILPEGSIRFIREQGDISAEYGKKEKMFISVIQDITEHENAKNLIELSPAILFHWKAEQDWPVDFVTYNIKQFGYSRADFTTGKVKYNDIIHPDDRDKVAQEVIQFSAENKDAFTQEYRIITYNGDVKWVDDRTTIERSTTGEVLYYTGIILDITPTKDIESELQALGQLLSDSLNEIYIFDKASLQFTYINHSAESNIGYSFAEMKTMTPIDIKPEFTSEQFLATIKPLDKGLQKQIIFETKHQRKNGSGYFVEVHCQLINFNHKEQYVAITLDISKRKKSLLALEQSESKYRRLVENLKGHYFFYTHDIGGVFTYVSDSVTDMLGYTQNEFLKHYDTYLTDESMNRHVHFYTLKSLEDEQQIPYEVSVYHKDGSIRYLEVAELPLYDENKKVIGIEGIARDISEQYRAEQTKEEQQKFLQSIIDGIHDPVMVINKDYRVKLMNKPVSEKMDNNFVADINHPK